MPEPADNPTLICRDRMSGHKFLESLDRAEGVVTDNAVGSPASELLRQAAADELAGLFREVADKLAASGHRPQRVPFGTGLVKRRSPKGFVLNPVGPQLLLPDGRLWTYHTRRGPDGIYYDARVDHTRSMHGSIPLGEEQFSFLGAVVGKYNFGYRHTDDVDGAHCVGALVGKGGLPQFVGAAEALADITGKL